MAMIMAIAVIIIISTILALALSLTSKTSKGTVNIYAHEQANLFARSALEYAKLQIGFQNSSLNRCQYTGEAFTESGIYNITISVDYIYNNTVSNCGKFTLLQAQDFGAAVVDVIVEVPQSVLGEPIRVFKRKLIEL